MTTIRFAFDSQGGFMAINDANRTSAYAYPSSDSAEAARTAPISTARDMLKDEWPCAISEARYWRFVPKIEGRTHAAAGRLGTPSYGDGPSDADPGL